MTRSASPSPIPLVTVVADFADGEWGFTGTRAGMTEFQSEMSYRILARGQPTIFHHGGAWGADTEVHQHWKKVCRGALHIWPTDEKRAALFQPTNRITVHSSMHPLTRNIRIVEESQLLIGAPNKEFEEQRSGTWQTIREALKRNKPVLILWPKSQKITLYRDKVISRVSYTVKDDTFTST